MTKITVDLSAMSPIELLEARSEYSREVLKGLIRIAAPDAPMKALALSALNQAGITSDIALSFLTSDGMAFRNEHLAATSFPAGDALELAHKEGRASPTVARASRLHAALHAVYLLEALPNQRSLVRNVLAVANLFGVNEGELEHYVREWLKLDR
jgi:hypothetical protein